MWKLLLEKSSQRIKIDIFPGNLCPFLLTGNVGLHVKQREVGTKEATLLDTVVDNLNTDFFVVKFCWALTNSFTRYFCSLWLIDPHIFLNSWLVDI